MAERAEDVERKLRPKTFSVRIDPELLGSLEEKAEALGVHVETIARWCLLTGLYLFDLDAFIRSKKEAEG